MSRVVWKEVLGLTFSDNRAWAECSLEVPQDAQFLYVDAVQGEPSVWFSCTPSEPRRKQKLAIVPTGAVIPEDGGRRPEHLGTFLTSGLYVWHVFVL